MASICVIGDAMRDVDIHLSLVKTMDGMPIYRESSITERPGGASNVALMCRELGADSFLLSKGISTKTRYFTNETSWRVDDDAIEQTSYGMAESWAAYIRKTKTDLILVCDHGKGVVNDILMNSIRGLGIPIYVDPCVKSDWSIFQGVTCVSANESEWMSCGEHWYDRISDSTEMIIRRADKNGVFYRHGWQLAHFPSTCRNPVDTVGAGDQFLAMLAVIRCEGVEWCKAVRMANISAGIQCERPGIVPLTMQEIISSSSECLSPLSPTVNQGGSEAG